MSQGVRETPATSPLSGKANPTRPSVPNEPVLDMDNIQGNIIGFNKDHQTFIFLKIADSEDFRTWLGSLTAFIATAAEVLSFNRLYKEIRRRRRVDTRTVQATWINIALSYDALLLLTRSPRELQERCRSFPAYSEHVPDLDSLRADSMTDEAFKQGMCERAVSVLSDPAQEDFEGHPGNWVFGGPDNAADVVVIIASDDASDLAAEVSRLEETIYSGRRLNGEAGLSGVQIIHKQTCGTLPPPLTGHEHFGYLDGVSQPGLRGRLSDDETDVLTLRQNPADPNQGKPGQDLVWPGEFIFGYPQQIDQRKMTDSGPLEGANPDAGPLSEAGPVWAKDGAYVVIRRLRQDVKAFRRFLDETSNRLKINQKMLGAMLVGRWESGAPILRANEADLPSLGFDDCANNHFEFQGASINIEPRPGTADATCLSNIGFCIDVTYPTSKGDANGEVCPFASHIRKAYPRDDEGNGLRVIDEADTQTHRLLRRGIPFGEAYYAQDESGGHSDSGNRGLMFVAYQTSIVEQFEFVMRNWVNNPNFKDKETPKGDVVSGHDMIIGQHNGAKGSRRRVCRVTVAGAAGKPRDELIEVEDEWVIPTGGGYFFAPSIETLCLLTGIDAPDVRRS